MGTVEYKYDSWNRLAEVIEGGDKTVYRYDEVGNLVQTTFPNGTVETREYDELYRLTNVQVVDSEDKVLSEFEYQMLSLFIGKTFFKIIIKQNSPQ